MSLANRESPLNISGDEFRQLGHQLVDAIATFFDTLPQRPVTPHESPLVLRQLLEPDPLPEIGTAASDLLNQTTQLLFDYSLFNSHPKFWGYITGSATPIGALADLLAAAVNPNVGAFQLSPMATEIEAQTIRWLADLIGYPRTCGGLLVSGGNMANFVGLLAARQAKVPWDLKAEGMQGGTQPLVAYVSNETHAWIDKAAELFGLGSKSIRWIATNTHQQMDLAALEAQITTDLAENRLPFLVVGTAGTVSTGAVDPLAEMAQLCQKYNLWFHVDGAYGAPAAALPDAPPPLAGLRLADSIALDPHKWLYSPLEAGCVLVRNAAHLTDTFSHHPVYYAFDSTLEGAQPAPPINFYEYGLQNSRGFRALKVWLALRQVGREGYIQMIGDDIRLAQALYATVDRHPQLQAVTQNLSITTFRFVPEGLSPDPAAEPYLNQLNEALLQRLQTGGEAFLSNAVVEGQYLLRACIVNFRTTLPDVEALPGLVAKLGRQLDAEMRPAPLSAAPSPVTAKRAL